MFFRASRSGVSPCVRWPIESDVSAVLPVKQVALTLDDLPTELALLSVPASKYLAFRGQSDKVVVACSELDNGVTLNVLECDRLELSQR